MTRHAGRGGISNGKCKKSNAATRVLMTFMDINPRPKHEVKATIFTHLKIEF